MSTCFRSKPKQKKRKIPTQQAHIIEISSETGNHRAAIASVDHKTEEDVVSQGIADMLGIEIYSIQKEARSAYPTAKVVYGETTLVWALEQDPRRVYSGTFYVSSDRNPDYDVVFGSKSAERLEAYARKSRQSVARSWFR